MNRHKWERLSSYFLVITFVFPFFLFINLNKVNADIVTWTGGDGNWETGSNWSTGTIPDDSDDIVISSNVTIDINGADQVKSLTLGNVSGTTTPILNFAYDAVDDGPLTVAGGNLTVYSGAIITHDSASGSSIVGKIYVKVENGNANIYGVISANEKGFYEGYGTGVGCNGAAPGGGGYGGEGTVGYYCSDVGPDYGVFAEPYLLGSGGGINSGGHGSGPGQGESGYGGGVVKVDVEGDCVINGSVSSNGGNGDGYNGAGGSGGSVHIISESLSGSGTISTIGGNSGTGGGGYGGGGGGGRIFLESTTYSFSGSLSGQGGSAGSHHGGTGGTGSVNRYDRDTRDLTIVSDQIWTNDDEPINYHDITLSSGITLVLEPSFTNGTDGDGIEVFASDDFTVPVGSLIVADGLGYSSGLGTGSGCSGDGVGGGGYGGLGGRGYGCSAQGSTYGSVSEPVDLGSGGGVNNNPVFGVSGSGGGAVKISSYGTLTVNGEISVNGANGTINNGGGGAGGSILLIVDVIAGSGVMEVKGGNSGTGGGGYGGGGGGGRISIHYKTNNFSGTQTTSGGTGGSHTPVPRDGQSGTTSSVQVSSGYVSGLSAGLDCFDVSTLSDLEDPLNSVSGTNDVLVKSSTGVQIAEFTEFFDGNRNFSDISGGTGGDDNNKSFFHVAGGFSNLPGVGKDGYILYVPIPAGKMSNSVVICPGATSLGDVSAICSNAIEKTEESWDTSKVTIGDQLYWKVEGLTGTGGISILGDFLFRDILTRLEISQVSDHTIEFGTVNGLVSIGDTIEVKFDPAGQNWDLGSIGIGDIDLEDDDTDLSLAAAADATHWGVSINVVTDTITFTHPTAADFEDILANSVLGVKIGEVAGSGSNQITNPSIAASYEIMMKNTYSAGGGGIETGEVEIPIVDDDTINVTGYLDTVLTFDLDTSVTDVNCDASGGADPCDSHSGASDNIGYVVDLGEMNITAVNKSGDSVLHADGLTGNVNYIWFDLESNADSGTVVTVVSLYESLYKDASDEIPSVATGSEQQITSADGLYGVNHRSGFTNSTVSGTINIHIDCDCTSGDDYYCDVQDGGIPIEVFNSSNNPVDDARIQFSIGVAPDSDNGTGTYIDQLTFIATGIF